MHLPRLLFAAMSLLSSSAVLAADSGKALLKECERVSSVYPLLMMAVMLEGPMNCGLSDDGSDPVDCAANETPTEKVAHARRFAIRQHQEAAYEKADKACGAWKANQENEGLRQAVLSAIADARAADTWRPQPAQ